jgi:hypothetical protein
MMLIDAVSGNWIRPTDLLMENNSDSDIPHGFAGLASLVSVLSETSAVPEQAIVSFPPARPSARGLSARSNSTYTAERSLGRSFVIVSATIITFAAAFLATSIFLWSR